MSFLPKPDGHIASKVSITCTRELRQALQMPEGFVIYSLRHTYGTRLGEAGADTFTIMRLMGHSSITVSQRYVHPTPEAMERAVERLEAMNTEASKKLTASSDGSGDHDKLAGEGSGASRYSSRYT